MEQKKLKATEERWAALPSFNLSHWRQDLMSGDVRNFIFQAIWEEGQGVRAKDVWDDNSVMEKSERIAQAQKDNKVIHIADVMPIASIKFRETPSKRKNKGRLVSAETR